MISSTDTTSRLSLANSARGGEKSRIYPCGNELTPELVNHSKTGLHGTSALGCFPGDQSPAECMDMTGHVWEWCRNTFEEYPYKRDEREDVTKNEGSDRVVRGGSWGGPARGCRCSYRGRSGPDGWDGNLDFWSARDGVITGQTTKENPTKGNTFLIWRQGELDDFELRLSFRIVGGNSGVQYRSKDLGNWVVGGYQADFDAGGRFAGILYDEKGRGILAPRGKKVTRYSKDKQEVADGTSDDETLLS